MEVEQLPYLSHEIVIVILTRLPVKSLLQFKRVCKQWYSSISDPQFVKMHLDQVSKRRDRIMLSSNPYLLVNPVYSIESESFYGYNPLERIDFPSMDPGPIGNVYGSCNGLVLIVYNDSKLFLWNPFMREYREVPYPHWTKPEYRPRLYGLGYDSANDDYKLALLIFDCEFLPSLVIFVFSLKVNGWKKKTEICKYGASHQQTRPAAAVVNGALHWVMWDCDDGGLHHYLKVVYFDLADEELKGIRLPVSLETNDVGLSLAVWGGCLCAVGVGADNVVNVWVMKEYGVRESWTNLINFTYYYPAYYYPICTAPSCFTKEGDIVVDGVGGNIAVLVGSIAVSTVHIMPFTHMESLVSVYGSSGSLKR